MDDQQTQDDAAQNGMPVADDTQTDDNQGVPVADDNQGGMSDEQPAEGAVEEAPEGGESNDEPAA